MKQTIIKTVLCVVVALSSISASAQVKAFEKYANMKDVTYVYISKYMLSLAGKSTTPQVPGVDIKALMNKLTGIQIIHAEQKEAQAKMRDDVQTIIDKNKYELLMQMNEEDNKVNIYHYIDKKQSAVVMFVEEDEEVTLMVFSGNFTLDDIMKMTQ